MTVVVGAASPSHQWNAVYRFIYRSGSTLMEVSMQPGAVPAPGEPKTLRSDTSMLEGWVVDLRPWPRRTSLKNVQGAESGGAPTPVNVVLN